MNFVLGYSRKTRRKPTRQARKPVKPNVSRRTVLLPVLEIVTKKPTRHPKRPVMKKISLPPKPVRPKIRSHSIPPKKPRDRE